MASALSRLHPSLLQSPFFLPTPFKAFTLAMKWIDTQFSIAAYACFSSRRGLLSIVLPYSCWNTSKIIIRSLLWRECRGMPPDTGLLKFHSCDKFLNLHSSLQVKPPSGCHTSLASHCIQLALDGKMQPYWSLLFNYCPCCHQEIQFHSSLSSLSSSLQRTTRLELSKDSGPFLS